MKGNSRAGTAGRRNVKSGISSKKTAAEDRWDFCPIIENGEEGGRVAHNGHGFFRTDDTRPCIFTCAKLFFVPRPWHCIESLSFRSTNEVLASLKIMTFHDTPATFLSVETPSSVKSRLELSATGFVDWEILFSRI